MRTQTRNFYKNYYEILGVPENAESQDIKKTYRKLALEHHPDHNPGDSQSEETFKEISEAYGVLIDPVKRREYDRYHAGYKKGDFQDASGFHYSQQDIFESMFRNGAARDIFEELNREFSRSGFRSGNSFFSTIFFGGAAGGLGRILGMIPGPIGKLGYGLRLVQMIGSSLMMLNQVRKASEKTGTPTGQEGTKPPLSDTMKKLFGALQGPQGRDKLDINLQISIPPSEALSGTKKRISYQADDKKEQMMVTIPAGIRSGKKLRIREKGYNKNGSRGDLIITVQVLTQ